MRIGQYPGSPGVAKLHEVDEVDDGANGTVQLRRDEGTANPRCQHHVRWL